MSLSTLKDISKVDIKSAYILYIVNIKDNYKEHAVFHNLNHAKTFKNILKKHYYLSGRDVYVNKTLGFHDGEEYIHCLNGFRYRLSTIENNETLCCENKYDMLLSKLKQQFSE